MIDYVNQETFVSSLLLVSSFVVGPNPAIFGSNMNGNKIFLAASLHGQSENIIPKEVKLLTYRLH